MQDDVRSGKVKGKGILYMCQPGDCDVDFSFPDMAGLGGLHIWALKSNSHIRVKRKIVYT